MFLYWGMVSFALGFLGCLVLCILSLRYRQGAR